MKTIEEYGSESSRSDNRSLVGPLFYWSRASAPVDLPAFSLCSYKSRTTVIAAADRMVLRKPGCPDRLAPVRGLVRAVCHPVFAFYKSAACSYFVTNLE